jgi:amino-acid N-acetyltransferase
MQNSSPNLYTPPVHMPILHVLPNTATTSRRATVSDVPRLYEMINHYAAQGKMLPKTLDHLYNRVREFQVIEAEGEVVGCAGLKITWHNLAEVVSLVVHPDFQGRSLGRVLVESLLAEATELDISTIFTLTFQVGFFSRLGFREVPRLYLPHKIWQDCAACMKQDHCDEVAMIREL